MTARTDPRTPGQRWRARRNLVIAVAHRAGLSQRLLADVFGLPRSTIHVVVADPLAAVRPKTGRGVRPLGSDPARPFPSSGRRKTGHVPE